jgi:hypothetical protein
MIELDEAPRVMPVDRKGVFNIVDKNSLHKHNGIYYLSCSAAYATSRELYGPYVIKDESALNMDLGPALRMAIC